MSTSLAGTPFAEEPPDGTRLLVWRFDDPSGNAALVYRDDAMASGWPVDNPGPDVHWFEVDGQPGPRTLAEVLEDATLVQAVVPLERSGLTLRAGDE